MDDADFKISNGGITTMLLVNGHGYNKDPCEFVRDTLKELKNVTSVECVSCGDKITPETLFEAVKTLKNIECSCPNGFIFMIVNAPLEHPPSWNERQADLAAEEEAQIINEQLKGANPRHGGASR